MNGLSTNPERMNIATTPQNIQIRGIFNKVIWRSVIVECLNVPNTGEMVIQHIANGKEVLSNVSVY